MVGTSNQSVPEMAIEIMCVSDNGVSTSPKIMLIDHQMWGV